MPLRKPRHDRVTSLANRHLGTFIEQHDLGALSDQSGFLLAGDPDMLLGPDLAFVRRERLPANEDGDPLLVPDLVGEVVSPSQTDPSIVEKIDFYRNAGVRLIWVLDPFQRTVRVCYPDGSNRFLTEQDEQDREDGLPGFRLPVARLFA